MDDNILVRAIRRVVPITAHYHGSHFFVRAGSAASLEPPVPGPEFFVIDFTRDKAAALALCRRLRELGLAAARDIMPRPLEESLAYARDIRAARAVVIDAGGLARGEVRVLDPATGAETAATLADLMSDPARVLEPAPGAALA